MKKTNPTSPIPKEFFVAWGKFRKAYSYIYESSGPAFHTSSPPCSSTLGAESLGKIIRTSTLSPQLKQIAEDLILKGKTSKKTLLLEGKATHRDFACINATLLNNIRGNTHSEQEKMCITDYFTYGFENKDLPPALIRYNILDYDTLHTVLSFKKVLTKDEESIVSLFLLGEISADELCDEERVMFVAATNKLLEALHPTDLEFYKQVAEYFLSVYPEKGEGELCKEFSLSFYRFSTVIHRYYPHTLRRVLEKERRKLWNS